MASTRLSILLGGRCEENGARFLASDDGLGPMRGFAVAIATELLIALMSATVMLALKFR